MYGHTFLTKPGMWIARGTVSDRYDKDASVDVVFTVSHAKDEWVFDEVWQYLDGSNLEYHMVNNVTALDPREGYSATSITRQHPITGKMVGKLFFAFDAILCHYTSTATQHTGGAMTFFKKSANDYIVRGYLVKDGNKFVSWTFEMMFSG